MPPPTSPKKACLLLTPFTELIIFSTPTVIMGAEMGCTHGWNVKYLPLKTGQFYDICVYGSILKSRYVFLLGKGRSLITPYNTIINVREFVKIFC